MIASNGARSPKFSVIIPNWNGSQHLDVCLQSLQHQTFRDFEVILVDNASTDSSVALVIKQYSEVQVLELDDNRGFTGACLAGFGVSKGQLVILLNNDTECDPVWLEVLNDTFEKNPQAGIVASKLLLFDHRDQFHAAGDFYCIDGTPGNRGVWEQDTGQYDQQETVFSACGAAAAYRRTMINEIGFLDDRFYFSCEDIDLAWRANLAGWEVIYAPDAIVYHKLKASGGSGAISSYYDGRNALYVIWKNYPSSLLRQHWRKILRAQFDVAAEALQAYRGEAARARLRGQLAGFAGLFTMMHSRRHVQSTRSIDDATLTTRLTPVDSPPSPR